ncbi:MAG: mannose-1-phosphate guanylyltransferase [Bacteroidales bacterium]
MINKNDLYCIVMAGGIGSRFWPLSRTSRPKQFIDILGTGKSLLQQTFDRMVRICPPENIIIVTSSMYHDLVLEQLPQINEDQVLLEPMRRNTAPCLAYANYKIQQKNPNAIAIVAPSDHLILNEDKFIETITIAVDFASKNQALVTLGIKPSRPETGYGYIQIDKPVKGFSGLHKVKTFTEKPNLELAKVFMESGEFFWNSGLFVWNINSIQTAFENFLPEVNTLFKDASQCFGSKDESLVIEKTYSECRNVSIDYGVMEKADNVFVVCSEFGWSDLGTWGSLYTHIPHTSTGNALLSKNIRLYKTDNTLVSAKEDKLVVVQGLSDYIVIDTDDVLLICKKQDEQQIKNFVSDIQLEQGEKYS